jgi:hypothetical protein
MTHQHRHGARGIPLACAVLVTLCAALPLPAQSQKVHGIVLSTHTNGSDWATGDIEATLKDMRAVGARWVAIHPYAGIRSDGTVRYRPLDREALPRHIERPLRVARDLGLKIVLKPHLAYWRSQFRWRGDIEFQSDDDWHRFWQTYSDWILNMVESCPEIDGLVVGTELDRTLRFEGRWRELIAAVRLRTKAPLTYAANWTHYRDVPFWDALDAVGIQAYFPLADSTGVDDAHLEAAWRGHMSELRRYSDTVSRPVVFTELGYNRAFAAPVRPWDDQLDGSEAEPVQAACLRIALRAVEQEPSVSGAFLWKWFPNPHPVGRTFQLATPRLKQVISEAWLRE